MRQSDELRRLESFAKMLENAMKNDESEFRQRQDRLAKELDEVNGLTSKLR
jgi:hypothetical protein